MILNAWTGSEWGQLSITRHRLYLLLAFIVALALPQFTTGAQANLSAKQQKELKAGKVLVRVTPDVGGSAGRVWAVIDIPVAPTELWSVMLDCRRAAKFLASLKTCTVLELAKDGSWDVREHRIQWLWILPEVRSVFKSQYVRPKSIRFHRTAGSFRKLMGQWELMPLLGGRRTRLVYQATVDPGLPLPGAIVRSALLEDLPKTLKALRKEAVSGAHTKR